jgi:ribosomal protein L11 methyltransferase
VIDEDVMTEKESPHLEALKELLRQVGPGKIWRPVYAPDNRMLAQGIGDSNDGLAGDLLGFAFKGKSVIDLGCNLGYYCFLVKKAGAACVLGIDSDVRLIRGCELLARLFQLEDIHFRAQDITTLDSSPAYDIGMMIDLIGKETIQTGLLPDFLNALERVSQSEMILSVRPIYRIKKHLGSDTQGLIARYSQQYVRNGCFHALDYVRDRFRNRWEMRIVAPKNDPEGTIKETLHLKRRGL